MAHIQIDGEHIEASPEQNLLQVCLSQKLDLPYFCWHPALGSVGACRQCAVIQYANEDDDQGRLVMACMTPVVDGARISLTAPRALEFRSSVIEWLMENHPHDCPVCEEGGECHLQDMTVMTGHTSRRFRGRKRTFENQNLGPFIGHEMNRCISCYRCVRFYRDYAGGTDLQAFGSRARMYFGRATDGVLESEFAGNLVEVCPTGVFTDKPFAESYTRKWDLRCAPSVCPGCAVGCNISPGERYGRLKRVHNRYHSELNGYFLCDRGRFGSHFVNSDQRLRQAGVRAADGVFDQIDSTSAVTRLAAMVQDGRTLGIGSARASLESNLALKTLVGEDRFVAGMSDRSWRLHKLVLDLYRHGGAAIASLKDAEQADAVLVLGEDVLNTAPRVALALRQASRTQSFEMAGAAGIPLWQDAGVRGHAQQVRSPLYIASLLPTGLADIATASVSATPEQTAGMGFAIARQLTETFAPSEPPAAEPPAHAHLPLPAAGDTFVSDCAAALAAADRPLIVAGIGADSEAVLKAAADIAWALGDAGRTASLLLTGLESNGMGLALLGAEQSLDSALDALKRGEFDGAIVLENDLYRHAAPEQVSAALAALNEIAVLDQLETRTAEQATVVLPSASYAESSGTLVNYEGRAQQFYQVFEAADSIQPAWRWLVEAATTAGRNDLNWTHRDQVTAACASLPAFARLSEGTVDASYRSNTGAKIPRQSHRATGRTAMTAHLSVHEPKSTVDNDSPFSFSMEGQSASLPGGLRPSVWSPGWNSNQSVFKFQQEVAGPLIGGEPGVCLIDGSEHAVRTSLSSEQPAPESTQPGLRLHAVHRIFGSDELSSRSPPIQARAEPRRIYLNREDARQFDLTDGGGAIIAGLGSYQVRIHDAIPPGHAGVDMDGAFIPERISEQAGLTADPNYVPPHPPDLIARG